MYSCLVKKGATFSFLLFCHQKRPVNGAQNCLLCELLYCLVENGIVSLITGHVFKNGIRIYVTHWFEFMVSEKMGLLILLALIVHHTFAITPCNSSS